MGELHREDGPAVEGANGTKEWYLNGLRHRVDGPAYEEPNGDQEWLVNGVLHRSDGPAIEDIDGYQAWYLNGVKHRLDVASLLCTQMATRNGGWRVLNTLRKNSITS